VDASQPVGDANTRVVLAKLNSQNCTCSMVAAMCVAATIFAATLFVYADATTPVLQPLGMGSYWQHLMLNAQCTSLLDLVEQRCALCVCTLCPPTFGAITILPGRTVCVGVYTYPSYTIRKPTYGIDAEKGKRGCSKWRGTTCSKICNHTNICYHLSVW